MTRFRLYEWGAAAILIWIGAVLVHPVEVWTTAASRQAVAVASEPVWGAVFLAVGLVRAIALAINGRAPQGSPMARAIGAGLSCGLFAATSVLFLKTAPAGLISGGLLLILAAMDCVIVWRATRELQSARRDAHA